MQTPRKNVYKLDILKQACKYSTEEAEAEARESLKVWGQHGQHMKFQISQEHGPVSNIYIETCSTLGCSDVSSPIQEWAYHYIWSQIKLSSNSDLAASSYRPLGFGESIETPKSQFSLVQYISVDVI